MEARASPPVQVYYVLTIRAPLMIFTRRFRVVIVVLALALFGLGFILYKMRLPKPQTASAAGQIAPDFTLTDQSGHAYHLADQRGHRVLLIFYRGYW